jgi:hypothetical protein
MAVKGGDLSGARLWVQAARDEAESAREAAEAMLRADSAEKFREPLSELEGAARQLVRDAETIRRHLGGKA